MSQTKAGAIKQVKTMKRKYGRKVFKVIGAAGGRNGHTGGFYHMKITGQTDRLKQISTQAGRMSKRGPAKEE